MATITLYKGVDVDLDQTNVYVDMDAHIAEFDHVTIELPDRMPPRDYIDVMHDGGLYNYAVYDDPEKLPHPLYFFVTDILRLTPNTNRYFLNIDAWASMPKARPYISGGKVRSYMLRVLRGTVIEGDVNIANAANIGGGEYADNIPRDIFGEPEFSRDLVDLPQWRCAFFLQYGNKVITSFFTRPTSYSQARAWAHQFIDQDHKLYAVPPLGVTDDVLIGDVTAKYQCCIIPVYAGQENAFHASYNEKLVDGSGGSIAVGGFVDNVTHTAYIPLSDRPLARNFVGTLNRRIEYISSGVSGIGDTDALVTITITLDSGCSVAVECCGNRIDVTNEFECAVVNDEANSYFTQNKIPLAINAITAGVGLAASAANPTMAAFAVPSIVGGIASNVASVTNGQVNVSGRGSGFIIGEVCPCGIMTMHYYCVDAGALEAHRRLYGRKRLDFCDYDGAVRVYAEDAYQKWHYVRFGECVPVTTYDNGEAINPYIIAEFKRILQRGTRVWVTDHGDA